MNPHYCHFNLMLRLLPFGGDAAYFSNRFLNECETQMLEAFSEGAGLEEATRVTRKGCHGRSSSGQFFALNRAVGGGVI